VYTDPLTHIPHRYRPLVNDQVNQFWMCDEGMLSYPEAYEGRLLHAHVGGDDATVMEALDAAKKQLDGHDDDPSQIAVVLSAQHSSEDNFALALLAKRYMGVHDFFVARRPDGDGDDILMSADKNPNAAGVRAVCERLGIDEALPLSELIEGLAADKYRFVISLGSQVDVDEIEAKNELSRLKGFVAICSHEGVLATAAHIALPACSWAETEATYINKDGIAQRTDAVLQPYGDSYPGWQLAVALGRKLGYDIDWTERADLERAMDAAPSEEAPEETTAPDRPSDVHL
jgi:NADH-quinone oxidoreductase subunit G